MQHQAETIREALALRAARVCFVGRRSVEILGSGEAECEDELAMVLLCLRQLVRATLTYPTIAAATLASLEAQERHAEAAKHLSPRLRPSSDVCAEHRVVSDLVSLLPQLVGVFALAFVYFWPAIPTGVALGVGVVLSAVTAWLAYVAGVLLVVLLGRPVRSWLMGRFGRRLAHNPHSFIRRAWDRFGLIALSVLAPVITGAQIAAAVGLALGARLQRLIIGLSLGAALWAVVISLLVVLGITANFF